MAKFFTSQHHGITALISEEHDCLFTKLLNGARAVAGVERVDYTKLYQTALEAGVKIFTFCSKARIERNPADKYIFTGTDEDLEQLITQGGHEMVPVCEANGWTGYTPFSNSNNREQDLMYRTTLRDVIDAFGIQAIMTKVA